MATVIQNPGTNNQDTKSTWEGRIDALLQVDLTAGGTPNTKPQFQGCGAYVKYRVTSGTGAKNNPWYVIVS
jgi:hypothetical protein